MRKTALASVLALVLLALTSAVPQALAGKGYARFEGVKNEEWHQGSKKVTVTWSAFDIGSGVHKVEISIEKVGVGVVGNASAEYLERPLSKTVQYAQTPVEVTEGLQNDYYRIAVVVYGAGPNAKAIDISQTYWAPP